jgi:hypothetical protein
VSPSLSTSMPSDQPKGRSTLRAGKVQIAARAVIAIGVPFRIVGDDDSEAFEEVWACQPAASSEP